MNFVGQMRTFRSSRMSHPMMANEACRRLRLPTRPPMGWVRDEIEYVHRPETGASGGCIDPEVSLIGALDGVNRRSSVSLKSREMRWGNCVSWMRSCSVRSLTGLWWSDFAMSWRTAMPRSITGGFMRLRPLEPRTC